MIRVFNPTDFTIVNNGYVDKYYEMKKNDTMFYNVRVKITPLKTTMTYTLDKNYEPITKALKMGNYVNDLQKDYTRLGLAESVRITAPKYEKKPYTYGERRSDNVNRAKQTLFDLVECNVNKDSFFLTLTTAESICDYDTAISMFKAFLQRFERRYGYRLQYVMTMERQQLRGLKENNEGAWHFHLIAFNLGYNEELKNNTFAEKVWTYGFIKSKKIYNADGSGYAEYIAKYVTKETSECVPLEKQLIKCSKGLVRPEIRYGFLSVLVGYYQKHIFNVNHYNRFFYESVNENGEMVLSHCDLEDLKNELLFVSCKDTYNSTMDYSTKQLLFKKWK